MHAIVFPFDLFGSAGTGAGAQLLADALEEMIEDARQESRPVRTSSFAPSLQIREHAFETLAACSDWRRTGRHLARSALQTDAPTLWLSGNHLGVLPLLEELGPDTLVIQFDAHLDIYNLSDCTSELSHGNFLRFAQKTLPPIIHVGSRDLFLTRTEARTFFARLVPIDDLIRDFPAALLALHAAAQGARSIWFDIDCDVFDPVHFPAVPNPQPFGLTPMQMLQILDYLWSDRVRGLSLSEFDPGRDHRDLSLSTLVWLIEWCLLRWHEPTSPP